MGEMIMLMMLLVVMATPIASDQSHSSLHRRRRNNDVINDGGLHRESACEDDTVVITCGHNRQLRIYIAEIKSAAASECDSSRSQRQSSAATDDSRPCSSVKAQQLVEESCRDKRNCSVRVDRRRFVAGDACRGVIMQLSVQFICDPIAVVTSVAGPSSTAGTTELETSRAAPCQPKAVRGVTWLLTPAGQRATANCPNSPGSSARWKCDKFGRWRGRPDFSDCVSSSSLQLQQILSTSNDTTITLTTMTNVTDQLLDVLRSKHRLYGGELDVMTDVMDDVVKRIDMVAIDANSSAAVYELFQAVVKTSDSLLSSQSAEAWTDLTPQRRARVASRMLRTLERGTLQLARTLDAPQSSTSSPVVVRSVASNIVLESGVLTQSDAVAAGLKFPAVNSLYGTSWQDITDHASLPGQAVLQLIRQSGGRMDYAFVMYNNLDEWLTPAAAAAAAGGGDDGDDEDECLSEENTSETYNSSCRRHRLVNSKIISAATSSSLSHSINLAEPLTFTLSHVHQHERSQVVCSFWKYHNASSDFGEWKSEGCSLVETNSTHTTCLCYHLTSFAIIMSPTAPQVSAADELALIFITYVGCTFSIICLIAAFLGFQFSRSVQGDRNTIHKNLVVNLFVANVVFVAGISQYSRPVLCAVVAGILHYFFLTSFAWMCLEGVQLYVMLVEVFEAEKSRVSWYYLTAYGVPAAIVAITTVVYHDGYGTPRHCWLSTDRGFIWSFIAPVIATLLVNAVMLGTTLSVMYEHSQTSALWRKERTTKDLFWSWIKGAFVLEVLLGLTWAFGLAFVSEQTVVFAYIFAILNSLQGTFIFIFHCVLNEKIRQDTRRSFRRLTCVHDSLRPRFGTAARSTVMSTGQHQSNNNNNNYLTKYLLSGRRRRQSSSSTTLSKSNSLSPTRRQPEGPVEQNASSVAKATDSGIEDTASYLEPSAIRLHESEFEPLDDGGSPMEGSVVDTDYVDRLATKTANGRTVMWLSVD